MTEQVASGSSLLKSYKIGVLSGTVESAESRTEMETTGTVSGGHGLTVGGTGATAPVTGRVETKITRYQTIMLKDESGRSHPIQLKNFEVPVSPGHKLSVFRLGGGGDGPIIHVYNHNSQQHYENQKALHWAMFPFLILFAALAVLAFVIWNWASGNSDGDGFIILAKTIVGTGLIGLVFYGIAHIFASIRAGGVRGNAEFKTYRQGLSGP